MTSRPEPDAQLVAAHDLARAALAEVTPATSIGDPVDYVLEDDGVVSLRFENRLAGYPGWLWTVSVARTDDAEPTVLEVELLPAEGALLAPEWVPWAERLADYHAQQAATAASAADGELEGDDLEGDDADDDIDDELDDELDDVEDLDAADFDDDGSPILHAGDLDGVDIDELDESNDDDELDESNDDDELDESNDDDDELDESDDDDELDESDDGEDESDDDDDESDEDDSAS